MMRVKRKNLRELVNQLKKTQKEKRVIVAMANNRINNPKEVRRVEALLDDRMRQIEQRIIEARKRFLASGEKSEPIIKRENGRTVITKSRTGKSMRQQYLEEKGYDFED